jgi:ubiquinone/menaquinone biosynthesis C-methylase UbiE
MRRLQKLWLPILRWGFHRLYREFAWTYDLVAWVVSLGHWRSWALSALPYLSGRVLEIGPGTGYLQEALAHRYPHRVLALEASPQMIGQTKRRLRQSGYTAFLVQGIAQRMPLADHCVDTVVATFPAEYILEKATAHEIARVLAPNGQIVIVDGGRIGEMPGNSTEGGQGHAPISAVFAALTAIGFSFTVSMEAVGSSQVMVFVGTRGETDGTWR